MVGSFESMSLLRQCLQIHSCPIWMEGLSGDGKIRRIYQAYYCSRIQGRVRRSQECLASLIVRRYESFPKGQGKQYVASKF